MKHWNIVLCGILAVLFGFMGPGAGRQVSEAPPQTVGSSGAPWRHTVSEFGRVPLLFIPNRGQTDGRVAYYVPGRDKTIFFSSGGLTVVLKDAPRRWVVKLDFIGARPGVEPVELESSGAVFSYFRGQPEEWRSNIPASSKIAYRDLWPGIDLIFAGTFDRMKYEFVVRPGADPSRIRLAYRGAESVAVRKDGRLEVKTPASTFHDDVPVAWQEAGGARADIPVVYALEALPENERGPAGGTGGTGDWTHVYGFEVGDYDRSRTLVIDPAVLVYCGFIGAGEGKGIAVDGSGNAYVAGATIFSEASFPVNVGPDLSFNGSQDVFVAKVNAAGTALVYCGYIGGSGNEWGEGIAVDSSGNAYVTGYTASTEATFPVIVGPDLTHNATVSPYWDGFAAKVNAAGTALEYCGYIGGSNWDFGRAIAVDGSGHAYVAGSTFSAQDTFPVTVGPDLTHNGGGDDAFIAKVNPAGSALEYCGYVGGALSDSAYGVAVDGSGAAYLAGITEGLPVAVGPDLTHNGGRYDAFVAKVSPDGSALSYCGFIGGAGADYAYGVAVDSSGSAYVTGSTTSTETSFPVTVGPDLVHNGGDYDAFVAKVSPDGSALAYCGFIGGGQLGIEQGNGIAVDGRGMAYITGKTNSPETSFPVVYGPDLTYNGGDEDAFVACVKADGTGLHYCGYIGGAGLEYGNAIAVDPQGNAYVAGSTNSSQASFPVVTGPFLVSSGFGDVFVAKVRVSPPVLTSITPSSASACDPAFTMTATGSGFIDGAAVLWGGQTRPTAFVNSSRLDASIAAADLSAAKTVEVEVLNPDGGHAGPLEFTVSGFTVGASPASVTVGKGQSAVYTIQVTPQLGSYNAAVSFSASGLPAKCTASFSPANVTPGSVSAMTTMTLATQATSIAAAGAAGWTGALALVAIACLATLLRPSIRGSRERGPRRPRRRRLAVTAAVFLVAFLAGCGVTDDGDGGTPNTGTPSGTYQITVQGQSSCLSAATTVTLIVR
jgi:hypothetical protein